MYIYIYIQIYIDYDSHAIWYAGFAFSAPRKIELTFHRFILDSAKNLDLPLVPSGKLT